MTKFFKRILQLLLAFVAIIVIAIIGIVNFVNPSQFKDTIEQEVLAKTGFVLSVQGPIQWRWFPMLSLEFNDIAIQNLAPFSGQLLSAKAIQAECKLLPIFLGKIALVANIKGLDLSLIRNATGQTNWENLNPQEKRTRNPIQSGPTTNVATLNNTNPASPLSITLNSLKIQEGKITFSDLSKNSQYVLSHLNFSADNLFNGFKGIATPLFLNFELASNNQTLANIFFDTEWALKKEKEQLNLQKIAFKCTQPNGISNRVTGDAEIQGFSKTPTIKGNLLGNTLQFGKIKIDEIKTTIMAQAGVIDFAPIDIQIAKSRQKATLKLDIREKLPKIYLSQEAHDFEISDLLALFGKKDKLSGKARLAMHLSATGTDFQTLQNSLSGKANIEINNGKLQGIDLVSLLKNAQASVHNLIDAVTQKLSTNTLSVINTELAKWKTDPNSSAFTPFNSVTASAIITNGVINNPDFAVNHAEYAINGAGTINPGANTVQYQAMLQLKNNPYPENDKVGTFLFQTPLQILIRGSLDDPKIQPDLATYTNSALAFAQKAVVEKAINKGIEKVLDKATGNEAIRDTVQKALGNILKPKQ